MKRFVFLIALLFSLLMIGISSAHVGYVLDKEEFEENKGPNYGILLNAISSPFNLFLMVSTVILVGIISFFAPKIKAFRKEAGTIEKNSSGYYLYIPLLSRVALAIALIGAGTSNVIISPAIGGSSLLGTLQVLLGFLFFTGVLTGLASVVTLGLYFFALIKNPYLLGNFDVVGLTLTILAIGSEKPGFSDILGIRFIGKISSLKHYIPIILSTTIGIAFIYLALFEKIFNSGISMMVVSKYSLTSIINVSPEMWVLSAGIIEFLVGLLILIRFKPRIVSVIALIVLSTTFFYFDEAVYSHITLFITLFLIFIIGKNGHLEK